ncbi:unnamed protein product [Polarella glacialis]|uniref:Uncharacterized protein n=1 Tax=Polarella glacialis TaxID=89957 RepID=A0A813DEG4_POLGL|nr:unnamed protein product [Polarella glacialis]CAE8693998.1 unnamed protein product [Polarella glacialis]
MSTPGRRAASGLGARAVRSRATGIVVLCAVAVIGVVPGLVLSNPTQRFAPVQLDSQASDESSLEDVIQVALDKVAKLRKEVDGDRVVRKYGQKAQGILRSLAESTGSAAPEVEAAVDGTLRALYLRQLALVQHRLVDKFMRSTSRPDAALAQADKLFVSAANDLLRPESDWSFESSREALRVELEDALRQESALAKERSRAAQTQRATADLIGKIQKQMEQIGEKVKGAGAGSPTAWWTSYQLPRTPFKISGRYQEGRTNIQLNLARAQDPGNAEAGFVAGLTPQNLGLSLNIGL